jgi:hypothetical protein
LRTLFPCRSFSSLARLRNALHELAQDVQDSLAYLCRGNQHHVASTLEQLRAVALATAMEEDSQTDARL